MFARHRSSFVLLTLALVYAGIVFVLAGIGAADWFALAASKISDYWPAIAMIAPLMLVGAAYRERRQGDARSMIAIGRDFLAKRGAGLFVPTASAMLAGAAYNIFKQQVLPRSGYGADGLLAQIDQMLLGGNDAWTITHGMLPFALVTYLLDLLYHPLFFPMTMGVALCTYLPLQSVPRFRYLAGLTLLLAGPATIGSWLVPAVGPCFDAALHDNGRYEALTGLLHAQADELGRSFSSLEYQAQLLRLFGTAQSADGAGISALPSIHNGMSTLFICFAISLRRILAWILVPYASLVFVGSVHLGWHYAIDGLAGILAAIVIWWVTAPLARVAGLVEPGGQRVRSRLSRRWHRPRFPS